MEILLASPERGESRVVTGVTPFSGDTRSINNLRRGSEHSLLANGRSNHPSKSVFRIKSGKTGVHNDIYSDVDNKPSTELVLRPKRSSEKNPRPSSGRIDIQHQNFKLTSSVILQNNIMNHVTKGCLIICCACLNSRKMLIFLKKLIRCGLQPHQW